jgi:hypothetical protein
MVIQLAEYCDKRAELTFEILANSANGMLEPQRSRLVRILKHCQKVKRFQRKLTKVA